MKTRRANPDRVKEFLENLEPNENRRLALIEELKAERKKPKLTLIKGGKS